MTTRQFINAAYSGRTTTQQCGSVFQDGNGNLYSYGYHYPLLFKVGNKTVRNVRGYSPTTQRHIYWCSDVPAIDIHAPDGFRLGASANVIRQELVNGQVAYIQSLQAQMDAKKRKDMNVYSWLEYKHQRALANLRELEA